MFVQDAKMHYVQNYVGAKELRVSSDQPVPPGKHSLRYEFEPTGAPDLKGGRGTPGSRQALRRRRTCRPGGVRRHRPPGTGVGQRIRRRPKSRIAGVGDVHVTLPVHRHDHQGDRRRVRESGRRRPGGEAVSSTSSHGTTVNPHRNIVLDDTGFRPVRLLWLADQHTEPRSAGVRTDFAIRTCTPRRCVRRRGHAC